MIRASQNLPERVRAVRAEIAAAAASAGRNVSDITLLAVSKAQPAEAVRAAFAAGLTDFGESYLNEALAKLEALKDLPLTWHFIGRLQANKTRPIAERFQWVHGIDRLHIAERLAQQRPVHAPPLNVCLQVNLAGESSKAGVTPAELPALAAAVAALARLHLRGLMCIPPPETAPQAQRAWFAQLRQLRDGLNAAGAALDTLSMGMSSDFPSAILEGSTLVRVGTALFGERPPRA
ncbi:MAG: YggS family pyridoxal phosphate-dependent enzyme [Pseudomonadota bacterium]|jgi:pyridoxal phosphate enzyme (YggS family)|nr:YggS family pyridoxal phosphate-dependent enzyme [Pseudomonadota bacterium]